MLLNWEGVCSNHDFSFRSSRGTQAAVFWEGAGVGGQEGRRSFSCISDPKQRAGERGGWSSILTYCIGLNLQIIVVLNADHVTDNDRVIFVSRRLNLNNRCNPYISFVISVLMDLKNRNNTFISELKQM